MGEYQSKIILKGRKGRVPVIDNLEGEARERDRPDNSEKEAKKRVRNRSFRRQGGGEWKRHTLQKAR